VNDRYPRPATCRNGRGHKLSITLPIVFHCFTATGGKIMAHVNPIQIQKFLKGVDYPATKAALIENAKNLGADENVRASLEQLPDEDFETPADVSQAFGKLSDAPEESSSATGNDEFLAQAMQDSLAEIELCELALQKTTSDEIKAFSQRMIDEHSRMGQAIEQIAGKKKIQLPKDISSEHKSVINALSKLSGQDFDVQFMDRNVKDHEKDIKVFKHYAEQANDADIKALAEKGVQTLKRHLDMAKEAGKNLQR
jgi:predicted outer membrane protein